MIETDYRHRAMDVFLRRRYGATPVHKSEMNTFLEAQADWYVKCKVCGEKIMGTPKDISNHYETCK